MRRCRHCHRCHRWRFHLLRRCRRIPPRRCCLRRCSRTGLRYSLPPVENVMVAEAELKIPPPSPRPPSPDSPPLPPTAAAPGPPGPPGPSVLLRRSVPFPLCPPEPPTAFPPLPPKPPKAPRAEFEETTTAAVLEIEPFWALPRWHVRLRRSLLGQRAPPAPPRPGPGITVRPHPCAPPAEPGKPPELTEAPLPPGPPGPPLPPPASFEVKVVVEPTSVIWPPPM